MEDADVEVKMQTFSCLICEKRIYSGIGKGCKMCGMSLENKNEEFCCKLCLRKYNTINKLRK